MRSIAPREPPARAAVNRRRRPSPSRARRSRTVRRPSPPRRPTGRHRGRASDTRGGRRAPSPRALPRPRARSRRCPARPPGRRGDPERVAVHGRQLAHELAVALRMCGSQVLRERARLLEGVEKPPVGDRNQHSRTGDPLLHRLPFGLREVGLGRHSLAPFSPVDRVPPYLRRSAYEPRFDASASACERRRSVTTDGSAFPCRPAACTPATRGTGVR